MRKIYISENKLKEIKKTMTGNNISHSRLLPEDTPPYEADEYEIGGEGGNNDYFHITESINGEHYNVDEIEYSIDKQYWFDEEEFENWENYGYNSQIDYLNSCWRIEGETFDCNGYHVGFFDGCRADIVEMFGDELAERMFNLEGRKTGPDTYRITDILYDYVNNGNVDLSTEEGILKGAKMLNNNGPSIYILTDGTVIGFNDHSQISSLGDMTINKFLKYGNIRASGAGFELMKAPNARQCSVLKNMFMDSREVYVDIAEPNSNEEAMYPKVIHSVSYRYPRIEKVVNDILRYFNEGIKPISENLEMEVEPSEVKLDSFRKNDSLAPRIWNGENLNSRARLKLLDIADDFWDFTDINWAKPKSIHLTGSICNYNWSKFSDIDLHIVADFSEIDEKKEFVQAYFDSKKNEWNKEHKKLKIYGFPVELYVEDVDAVTASEGIYDLEENKWIKYPEKDNIEPIKLDKYEIKNKSAKLMTSIDDIVEKAEETSDDAELRQIGKKAKRLLNYTRRMRKYGLERGGESDAYNIVFKVLRRNGYMEKLWNLSSSLYDKLNSIGIDEGAFINEGNVVDKERLDEYLEKNNNYPLYRYFKWASEANDYEKALELALTCPWYITSYIDARGYDSEEFLHIDSEKEGDIYKFAGALSDEGDCEDFLEWVQYYGDYNELPAWMTMDFIRIVKNEWCIHFTECSDDISHEGFTQGTDDFDRLAYTNAGGFKSSAGYDFAFLVDDRHVDFNNYGSEAVIFRTSGVLCYHHGDGQYQVVFYGPNVKEFIPIKNTSDGWTIEGQHYQTLKSADKPSEIVDWVMDNLPQYRKQVMTGKNGYIPKRYNPVKDKVEPYDLYKNESVMNYIKVLKEYCIKTNPLLFEHIEG